MDVQNDLILRLSPDRGQEANGAGDGSNGGFHGEMCRGLADPEAKGDRLGRLRNLAASLRRFQEIPRRRGDAADPPYYEAPSRELAKFGAMREGR